MERFDGQSILQFDSDTDGNAAAYKSVLVELVEGGVATLYGADDTGGSTISNPMQTSATGFFYFYAVNGKYKITIGTGGEQRIVYTTLFDESDNAILADGVRFVSEIVESSVDFGLGWLQCDGAVYMKGDYPDLGNALGTFTTGSTWQVDLGPVSNDVELTPGFTGNTSPIMQLEPYKLLNTGVFTVSSQVHKTNGVSAQTSTAFNLPSLVRSAGYNTVDTLDSGAELFFICDNGTVYKTVNMTSFTTVGSITGGIGQADSYQKIYFDEVTSTMVTGIFDLNGSFHKIIYSTDGGINFDAVSFSGVDVERPMFLGTFNGYAYFIETLTTASTYLDGAIFKVDIATLPSTSDNDNTAYELVNVRAYPSVRANFAVHLAEIGHISREGQIIIRHDANDGSPDGIYVSDDVGVSFTLKLTQGVGRNFGKIFYIGGNTSIYADRDTTTGISSAVWSSDGFDNFIEFKTGLDNMSFVYNCIIGIDYFFLNSSASDSSYSLTEVPGSLPMFQVPNLVSDDARAYFQIKT